MPGSATNGPLYAVLEDQARRIRELEAALAHARRVADAERRRAELLGEAAKHAYRWAAGRRVR